ncbi:MAG: nuclear transport factor 2 family protein [Bacteroidota bacterium]
MKRILLIVLVCFTATFICKAQNDAQSDQAAVINTIKKMFDSMRAADSTGLRSVFMPNATLFRTTNNKEGKPVLINSGGMDGFIKSVGGAPKNALDEKIWSYDVRIEQNLATAWTDFTFYYNGKLSHCGVNAFQLFRSEEGWKIFHITDTRSETDCITASDQAITSINDFMNDWHKAATDADFDKYFDMLAEDSYFIGTDETERWNKEQFMEFAKKPFNEAPAWDFKTIERNVELSGGMHYAWFDEKLDTWMGVCRGSGMLQKTDTGWELKHYVLSVTVPNDKIDGHIKNVKK